MRKVLATLLAGVLLNPAMVAGAPLPGNPGNGNGNNDGKTATPIKHLVIIFQENISFDHYFGTYPVATNPKGEPQFHAASGTPTVNGLTTALLNNNPNFLNAANGAGATNPFRFDRSAAATEDQNHDYLPEQEAFDAGLMDAVSGVHRNARTAAVGPSGRFDHRPNDGLLRRKHGDGVVELRATLRYERQLLRHGLWSLDSRRYQSGLRPNQWRH